MSSDTDRAARLYVSSQLVGAIVVVALVAVVGVVLLVSAISGAARSGTTPAPTTTRSDCWDYAFGAAFPPGWSAGDAPLPPCTAVH
jgi:hypothetical protein